MKKKILTIAKFLLFLGFGVFLLWLITRGLTPQDKKDIFQSFREANYLWILLSICLGIISHISRAERWRMLIRPLGYQPRFNVTFYAVMVGYIANLAFPRLGEVTKCGVVSKYDKIPADKIIGTMILERTIDLISLILVVVFTLAFQFNLISGFFNERILDPMISKYSYSNSDLLKLILIILVIVGILILSYRAFKKTKAWHLVRNFLSNIKDGLLSIRKVRNLPMFLFHSVFIWVMYYLMIRLCFYAVPEVALLGNGAGLTILAFGSLGIIATPGGIGAYQLIVTEILFNIYNITHPVAYAFSWIVWSGQTIMIVTLGTLSLIALPFTKLKPRKDEQAT